MTLRSVVLEALLTGVGVGGVGGGEGGRPGTPSPALVLSLGRVGDGLLFSGGSGGIVPLSNALGDAAGAIKAKVVACPAGVSDREGHAPGPSGGEEAASLGPQGTDEGDGKAKGGWV